MTHIGSLDKRVTLQYPTMVADGMGGFTETWTTAATVWGSIWPVSASEQVKAGTQTMVASHQIRIRYRTVLRASWRVLYNGRYFSIVSITDPSEKHEWLDLLCKESLP